MVDDIQGGPKK